MITKKQAIVVKKRKVSYKSLRKAKPSNKEMPLEDKLFSGKKPNTLFFDIETTPLKAWVWRLGEQVLRHHQLDKEYNQYDIMCIAYKLNDEPTRILHWDYHKQDSRGMIEKFDKIANKADIIVGKNSDRFDIKHLNTQRLLHGLPGLPQWLLSTDDLERQFRKYFTFPSFGLDYLSETLIKTGGKDDMELDDWIKIVEKTSPKAFYKMLKYCKKDVDDLAKLWNYASTHFKPRYNHAASGNCVCPSCGSHNIKKNGTRRVGKTVYQMFYCNSHGGYGGKAPINMRTEEFGKLGL